MTRRPVPRPTAGLPPLPTPGKRRRTGAKIATKREEGELLEHARRLAEDPAPLVPESDGARPAAIVRLERRLARVAKARKRPFWLKWYMRTGPRIARAYANLLLVAHGGKARRMGSMNSPVGPLKYAVRGNISPRHVVALQHFRHPEVRLLGYRELANDAGGIIWASEAGLHYAKHAAPPPEAWFHLVADRAPIDLLRSDDGLRCPHLADVEDPHAPTAAFGLELTLRAGDTHVLVCEPCIRAWVRESKRGVLATLAQYWIGLRADKEVTLRPTGTPRSCEHEGPCAWVRHTPPVPAKTLDMYLSGRMTEADVLDRILPRWEDEVRAAGEALLVTGLYCHGDDRDALLDILGLDGGRREVVGRFLDATKPMMAKERTLNHVLEACWGHAPAILASLHPDPAALDALLERHKRSPPAVLLEEVLEARRAHNALAGFPRYANLPLAAGVADRLARAHRIGGMPGLVEAVDRELKRTTNKGVLWAALKLALATQGREWQFSPNDREAGEFLAAPFRAVLDADAAAYHGVLGSLHTLAGGSGDLAKPVGKV